MEVSFIIPIFNNSLNDLRRVVNSVRKLKNSISYEILLIDDGSKDNFSVEYEKFSSQYEIKYFKKNNSGVSDTRNYGLKKSTGKYIVFLDADDQFKAKNFVLPQDNTDLVVYNIEREDVESGKKTILRLNNLKKATETTVLPYLLKDGVFNFVTGKIYLKKFLNKYQIEFDPKIAVGEDLDFVSQVILNKPKIQYIDKVLYTYLFKTSTGEERIRRHPLQNLNDAINVYKLRKTILSKVNITNAGLKEALIDDIFEIYSRYLVNDKISAKKNSYLFIKAVKLHNNNLNKKAQLKASLIINKRYLLITTYLKLRQMYKKVK